MTTVAEGMGSPIKKIKSDVSELKQLKQFSLVVADTGDFNQL